MRPIAARGAPVNRTTMLCVSVFGLGMCALGMLVAWALTKTDPGDRE